MRHRESWQKFDDVCGVKAPAKVTLSPYLHPRRKQPLLSLL